MTLRGRSVTHGRVIGKGIQSGSPPFEETRPSDGVQVDGAAQHHGGVSAAARQAATGSRWLLEVLLAGSAIGFSGAGAETVPGGPTFEEVVVTATRVELIGTAATASEGLIPQSELALAPAFRPGQMLETVPGLDVTTHSGEGKASQYLMRGYNLDHGTDLAVFVDGMPINEPTHAHGQGYTDLNFLVPELVRGLRYTKGTYYPAEGDFASVGAVHIDYADSVPTQASATVGGFGFERVFGAASSAVGRGELLAAAEVQRYDGPWANPDDQRKLNGLLRFSNGTAETGQSLTAMFYHATWNSTTDQPVRAMAAGEIGRFGSLDPSDGGQAQRESLSWRYAAPVGPGHLDAGAFVIGSRLTLWNDFTHFMVDPVYGDQEAQHEDRTTVGVQVAYQAPMRFGGADNDVAVGLGLRQDFIDVSRLPTRNRMSLPLNSMTDPAGSGFAESDNVRQIDLNAYVQLTTHWTSWLRTVAGIRVDHAYESDSGTNSGSANQTLAQPKVSLIVSCSTTTEFYLSAGRGFHSDDARGVNEAQLRGIAGAPLLATQTGEEIGLRQEIHSDVSLTAAVFNLAAQSESTYDPDVGQDVAGPASRRYGAELNVTWQALRWLGLQGSYSINHSRYKTPYADGTQFPDGVTPHVGYYLPNAPSQTASLHAYVKDLGPWSGALEYRYLGTFPLSSDNVVRGTGYGEWSAELGFTTGSGWKLGASLFNLFNARANAAEFWYNDRLADDPVSQSVPAGGQGISGLHIHPLEPFTLRLSVSKSW